jgi:DNA-binding response OmpR family regulator
MFSELSNGTRPGCAPLDQPSILVVDDDAGVCQILERILSRAKYDVQIAQSVEDAARTIDERLFDAYLLDYLLLDGSGLDVAKLVRRRGSKAPIFIVTGTGAGDLPAEAEVLSISGVIAKPFSMKSICAALEASLTRSAGFQAKVASATDQLRTRS